LTLREKLREDAIVGNKTHMLGAGRAAGQDARTRKVLDVWIESAEGVEF
jgi:hypothetical protein